MKTDHEDPTPDSLPQHPTSHAAPKSPDPYRYTVRLSEAEIKALQQRKLALGEYAMKIFAEDRRTSSKSE